MRNCLLIFVLLMIAMTIALSEENRSGETRKEITTPAAASDSKPNSPDVPDAYAVRGNFDRVLIFRFKDDTDLLAGLEKMVKQEKIRNGVILSGIGSVRSYNVHQVSNRTYPTKNVFVSAESPADIANMNGYVINGKLHPHITLASPEKAFGGHLEPRTKVFTFAIVTLGVLDDGIDLNNMDNKAYR
jgi:predicted DNA-binding protein with PD1-like motif